MNRSLKLRDLQQQDRVSGCLRQAGMHPAEADAKANAFADLARKLASLGTSPDQSMHALYVPGRIEVLGKHTDYCGGRSLLATVERGMCLAAAPRTDNLVRIVNLGNGEQVEFRLEPDLAPVIGHWSNYPMTAARRIARNFPGALCGADIAMNSDLPLAAGLSSSSVFIVGMFMVLASINDLQQRPEYRACIHLPEDLAGYLGTVENGRSFGPLAGDRGVGTFGGSEDHTAILCCHPNRLAQYSFCPVKFEREVAMPAGYGFVIGVSGVVAEKTGAARELYNQASLLASESLIIWRSATGRDDHSLAAAIGGEQAAFDQLVSILRQRGRDDMVTRVSQFFQENWAVIPAAGDALARGDMATFGERVDRSQEYTDKLLGNQVPETVFLASSARELGAAAASAFGAGFGGSVWAVVKDANREKFISDWQAAYRRFRPAIQSQFFYSGAGPSLVQIT